MRLDKEVRIIDQYPGRLGINLNGRSCYGQNVISGRD